MTNEELERLARAAADNWPDGVWVEADGRNLGVLDDADTAFIAAADPATILALLSERAELLAAVERMRGGLEKIERWHGEFPSEDWVNDDGSCTPAPYGVRYGSNGERDFMRGVARAALTTGEANHKDKP